MRVITLSLGILALLIGLSVAEDANDTFTNPTFGISVTKPADWQFMSAEQNLDNLKRTIVKDEEFQQLLQRYATAPLVVMAKYPEPFDDLNPSLKVNVRPLGELPGMQNIPPEKSKLNENYSRRKTNCEKTFEIT